MGQTQPKRLLRPAMSFLVITLTILIVAYSIIFFWNGRFLNIAFLYGTSILFSVVPAVALHLLYGLPFFPREGRRGFLFQIIPVAFLLLTFAALAFFPFIAESLSLTKQSYFTIFFILVLGFAVISLIPSFSLYRKFIKEKLKDVTIYLEENQNTSPLLYPSSYTKDTIYNLQKLITFPQKKFIPTLIPTILGVEKFIPEAKEQLRLLEKNEKIWQEQQNYWNEILEENDRLLEQIATNRETFNDEYEKIREKIYDLEIKIQKNTDEKYEKIKILYNNLKYKLKNKFLYLQSKAEKEAEEYSFYAKLSPLEKDKFLSAFITYHFSHQKGLQDRIRKEQQLMALLLLCQVVEIIMKERIYEPFKQECQNPPQRFTPLKRIVANNTILKDKDILLKFIENTGFLTLGQMFSCIETSRGNSVANLYLFLKNYTTSFTFDRTESGQVSAIRNALSHINQSQIEGIDIEKERKKLLTFIKKLLA